MSPPPPPPPAKRVIALGYCGNLGAFYSTSPGAFEHCYGILMHELRHLEPAHYNKSLDTGKYHKSAYRAKQTSDIINKYYVLGICSSHGASKSIVALNILSVLGSYSK